MTWLTEFSVKSLFQKSCEADVSEEPRGVRPSGDSTVLFVVLTPFSSSLLRRVLQGDDRRSWCTGLRTGFAGAIWRLPRARPLPHRPGIRLLPGFARHLDAATGFLRRQEDDGRPMPTSTTRASAPGYEVWLVGFVRHRRGLAGFLARSARLPGKRASHRVKRGHLLACWLPGWARRLA